jgi:hypothetical protein
MFQGVYNTEVFSYTVCAMFAALAVAQLAISGIPKPSNAMAFVASDIGY